MDINHTRLLRWVLVETSHPGNVGSAARALKTMGFADLRLINPKIKAMAEQSEAIALASGALDLLESSTESESFESAVQGCSLVLGLTSREREFGPPPLDWASARALITETVHNKGQVALVFGPERTGLENHHLSLCTHRVWLDANPDYPSLNLSQALMVCAYTLREAFSEGLSKDVSHPDISDFADPAAVAAMLEHWREGLEAIGYLDPSNPKKLMPRLEALFARSRLRKEEIDLLRGIAKQMLLRK
ncbi:RNA methyltransferase [Polynucleobacter wuianus]|uniref:RNA methyltransferase n=1 Tax=Polynucleobacter wuianus TaxID=1743168 RepID=A0A191UF19_9BURK|nr:MULTISPECIES: RNA methyltransferase [Polynucleobacter]ANI99624.1 RNA methyltransferase [Polynucleobacter wuianus]MBU3551733.1 RNA methyltransferase [Polynucleobacter sp. MWH-Post4-6-1]MBU3610702.1 RNA methyltransferase [Polynucleobacter wuianus]